MFIRGLYSDFGIEVLVAIILVATGILLVAAITQTLGYRVGGVIVIPMMVLYSLKNFVMFPLFIGSSLTAYIGLNYIKKRTMIYGRTELIASILIGSIFPALGLVFIWSSKLTSHDIFFIGSILPGIAAYNYQHTKSEYLVKDLYCAVGIFIVLFGIGWALITPELSWKIGYITPPFLFSQASDIAILKQAVVNAPPVPLVLGHLSTVTVFLVSMILSEKTRWNYGIRVGIVSMGIMAIFALENKWLALIYVGNLIITYGIITRIQNATLLYGRNLQGLGILTSLLLTVPEAMSLPIVGSSILFVGIIAGINGYNLHVTPPAERKIFIPLQILVFLPTYIFSLTLLHKLTETKVFLAVLITLIAVFFVKKNWISAPSEDTVHEAFFKEESS